MKKYIHEQMHWAQVALKVWQINRQGIQFRGLFFQKSVISTYISLNNYHSQLIGISTFFFVFFTIFKIIQFNLQANRFVSAEENHR